MCVLFKCSAIASTPSSFRALTISSLSSIVTQA